MEEYERALGDDRELSKLKLEISRLSKEIERGRVSQTCTDGSKGCKAVKRREQLIKAQLDREKSLFAKHMVP